MRHNPAGSPAKKKYLGGKRILPQAISKNTDIVKLIDNLEEGLRIFCGDHRFEEFPSAVPATEVAVRPCDADGSEALSLRRGRSVVIRNGSRDGKGEDVAKMVFSNPKGLGLELF